MQRDAMSEGREPGVAYTHDLITALELRWGRGFLSPGGGEEVARMLDGLDLHGCEVLDIGCGTGGVDLALVQDWGAKRVIGIDIEQTVLDRAVAGATAAGLSDRLSFELVEPGPLPKTDSSFDMVFSKDAIIHVADKRGLYAEVLRVLRPGGVFIASDWFGGEAPFSKEMESYIASGHLTFNLDTLKNAARHLWDVGFMDVETRDRNAWYRERVREELAQAEGPDRARLVDVLGEHEAAKWIERMRAKAIAVEQGHLRPGYIRGRKPA